MEKDLVQLYDDKLLSKGTHTKIYPKTKAGAVYVSTSKMLDRFLEEMNEELRKYSEDVVTSIPDIYQKILLLREILAQDDAEQGLIRKIGEIFQALPTFTKIYHITEADFANLQKNQTEYRRFIEDHLGWDIEVIEGEGSVEPDNPVNDPTITDGVVTLQATIDSNGVLTISKELYNKIFVDL